MVCIYFGLNVLRSVSPIVRFLFISVFISLVLNPLEIALRQSRVDISEENDNT